MGYWLDVETAVVDAFTQVPDEETGEIRRVVSLRAIKIIRDHSYGYDKSGEFLGSVQRGIFAKFLIADGFGELAPYVEIAFEGQPEKFQSALYWLVSSEESAAEAIFSALKSDISQNPEEWLKVFTCAGGLGVEQFHDGWHADEAFIGQLWGRWMEGLEHGARYTWGDEQLYLLKQALQSVYGQIYSCYALFYVGLEDFQKKTAHLTVASIGCGYTFAERKKLEQQREKSLTILPKAISNFVMDVSSERKGALKKKGARRNLTNFSSKPSGDERVKEMLYPKTPRKNPVLARTRTRTPGDGTAEFVAYDPGADPRLAGEKMALVAAGKELLHESEVKKRMPCYWYGDVLVIGSAGKDGLATIVEQFGWRGEIEVRTKGFLGNPGSVVLHGCPSDKAFHEFVSAFKLISQKKILRARTS
ncbi:hypothetical protein [Streptomyces vinaceus]|uniref:hypothetical protein n=1 Tax=Streptomyces vinaceus TaxID=1960 RepID=UPI0038156DDD